MNRKGDEEREVVLPIKFPLELASGRYFRRRLAGVTRSFVPDHIIMSEEQMRATLK